MINEIKRIYSLLNQKYASHMRIFRFIISGGMATVTNLAFLFLFHKVFGIWYITSSIASYLISFAVSFSMQKYWTFNDNSIDRVKSQAIIYVVVTTINLGINTLLIYIFVEKFGFDPLIAQIVSSIIIAIESFLVYKVLFKTKAEQKY
jgi:putative flippase GtrA